MASSIHGNFPAPKDLGEAKERVEILEKAAQDIELLLRSKNVRDPSTGQRLTRNQFFEWHDDKMKALKAVRSETHFLHGWIRQNTPRPIPQPPKEKVLRELPEPQIKAKVANRLLWRCSIFFRRLRAENPGLTFSPEEIQLFDDVEQHTKPRSTSFLREARDCRRGSFQAIFQLGAIIARTTGQEEDFQVLQKKWVEAQALRNEDEDVFSRCAEDFAGSLTATGQLDQAREVLGSFDGQYPRFAYQWLELARVSGDEQDILRARTLLPRIGAPAERMGVLQRLYELTGLEEDLRAAWALATSGHKQKRPDTFKMSLIPVLVRKGRLAEACELAESLGEENRKAQVWAEIGRATNDVSRLTPFLENLRRLNPRSVRKLAGVFGYAGHHDHFERALDELPSWLARCSGYSVLAKIREGSGDVSVARLVDKAEQTLILANVQGSTDEAAAFRILACLQAMQGRMERAVETTDAIVDLESKCRGFLVLHCVAQGEPVPDFLLLGL